MASYLYNLWFHGMEKAEDSAEERPKGVLATLAIAISRTISVIISLAVPVCMVISGGFWFSDCPQEKNIPIYLLVGGIAYLLLRLLNFANKYYGKSNNEDNKLVTKSCFISLIHIFLFVWFILGSVRVYNIYKPNYDPELGPYCNENLYLFAFWLTTAVYIIIALKIIFICGLITVFACKEWKKRDTTLQQDAQQTEHQEDTNFIGVAISEPTS